MLWTYWWNAIIFLRPAFSRNRTFMWFVLCVAGLTIRNEMLGVTSIVRALGLHERFYNNLLNLFHSDAIKLNPLTELWTKSVLALFPNLVTVNGRLILIGDGIKIGKQGKKMPSVKKLHQQSESNSKAEYIMGHSFQAISILSRADNTFFAVPLTARIHEGIVLSNRDKKTLLDKMIDLIQKLKINKPYYFVADAYYASQKIVKGLLKNDNHLVTRVKSNAVAYQEPEENNQKKRGRPKKYGKKIKLSRLLKQKIQMEEAESPIYGEKNITIRYSTHDLLWRPAGTIVRFIVVIHPTRGSCILMSTDTSLSPIEIIKIYGLRFKIEHSFKQAVHVIGTFSYHFWMAAMKPLKRNNGNQYLHRETKQYREMVKRKLKAYHVFVQAGIIAQGLLHHLASSYTKCVWSSFGSWLRTIRPGLAPSELVVATALRNSFPEFLLGSNSDNNLKKFIADRQDLDRMALFRMA